ncbi:MAG: DNA polymerase III subunit gamma/tau [Patescibacteria group bacterium]|jgi:DNA polymerase-3 subunit gamma/tau
MAVSLYRKYRPQTFADVVGQNHVKVTLQNEVKQGNLAHAYLFSGPRGIGKTSIARILAKAVNCIDRKNGDEPCDKCEACEEVKNGNCLDVIEIDAASHTGVDNVRENIIENARFNPSRWKYKVFIIDEVHMLSLSAFNALLKIMEEPPAHVIFILCTTEIHKIPATIISRCQRFDFKKVVLGDIVNHLSFIAKKEGVSCDKEVLMAITRHSEGYLRDAVGLLGQILSLGEKKITLEQAELVIPRSNFILVSELVDYLVAKDTARALQLINRLANEGVNLVQFTIDLVEFLRKILLVKISGKLEEFALEFEADEEKKIIALLDKLDLKKIVLFIDTFVDRLSAVKQSAITQLPLEMAVVELCGESTYASATLVKEMVHKKDDNVKPAGGGKEDRSATVVNNDPESQPEVEEKKKVTKSSGVLKIEDVSKQWNEIITKISEDYHSLALTLKVSKPLEVDNNVVKIGFKYKFHQERIADNKNKLTLENILSKLLGVDLLVEPVFSDDIDIETPAVSSAPSIDVASGVAEMFGGKVVG